MPHLEKFQPHWYVSGFHDSDAQSCWRMKSSGHPALEMRRKSKNLPKEAVKTMGLSIEVEYITDMEKVMAYGVMSMPALVVNDKVVAMGKVLKAADVEKLLHKLGF